MTAKLIGYRVKVKRDDHRGETGEIVALAQDGRKAGWSVRLDSGEYVILTKLSEFDLNGKKAGKSYGPN